MNTTAYDGYYLLFCAVLTWATRYATTCSTLIIRAFQYRSLINLPKKLGKKTQTAKSTKNDHFLELQTILPANIVHKTK